MTEHRGRGDGWQRSWARKGDVDEHGQAVPPPCNETAEEAPRAVAREYLDALEARFRHVRTPPATWDGRLPHERQADVARIEATLRRRDKLAPGHWPCPMSIDDTVRPDN